MSLILRVILSYNHPQLMHVFCEGKTSWCCDNCLFHTYRVILLADLFCQLCALLCHDCEMCVYLRMHSKEKNQSAILDAYFVLHY